MKGEEDNNNDIGDIRDALPPRTEKEYPRRDNAIGGDEAETRGEDRVTVVSDRAIVGGGDEVVPTSGDNDDTNELGDLEAPSPADDAQNDLERPEDVITPLGEVTVVDEDRRELEEEIRRRILRSVPLVADGAVLPLPPEQNASPEQHQGYQTERKEPPSEQRQGCLQRFKNKKWLPAVVLSCVLVIAAVVVPVVILKKDRDSSSEDDYLTSSTTASTFTPSSFPPSPDPQTTTPILTNPPSTFSPTEIISTMPPTNELFNILFEQVARPISGTDSLSNPSSPQYRTLRWMAYEDLQDISLDDDGVLLNKPSFIQRYVISLLYHATGGADNIWLDDLDFLSNTSVCLWSRYLCVPVKGCYSKGITCRDGEHVNMIFIDNNNLTGTIPEEIGQLSYLENLIFMKNNLFGSIPSSVYELPSIIEMEFSSNYLTGTISSRLDNLPQLLSFAAVSNLLTGSIPDSIGVPTNLVVFLFGDNILSGTIPPSIWSLRDMFLLDMSKNKFVGSLPAEFGADQPKLSSSALNGNMLQGTLPSSVGDLSSLEMLSLDNNFFNGEIPNSITNVTALTLLGVSNNSFTGTIPQEFGRLTDLTLASFGYNNFTGGIPSSFKSLTKLQMFDVAHNSLKDTLPSFLGTLTDIVGLFLSYNNFFGTVPLSFQNLTKLEYLLLNGNDLTGEVNFLNNIDFFTADCGGTRPEIECNFCTMCCDDETNSCI